MSNADEPAFCQRRSGAARALRNDGSANSLCCPRSQPALYDMRGDPLRADNGVLCEGACRWELRPIRQEVIDGTLMVDEFEQSLLVLPLTRTSSTGRSGRYSSH